ncbi:hypothetical protein TNCV_1390861 [Trichonephila clavipes]|nr:hypothetical protein TNCV_1390861 [Trichonephila clavipes]
MSLNQHWKNQSTTPPVHLWYQGNVLVVLCPFALAGKNKLLLPVSAVDTFQHARCSACSGVTNTPASWGKGFLGGPKPDRRLLKDPTWGPKSYFAGGPNFLRYATVSRPGFSRTYS